MASIVDGCIHCREDVGAEAASGPADLIHGESRAESHATGRASGVAKEACVGDGGAGRGCRSMGAMAVSIARGFRLMALVDWSHTGFISLGEESRANKLAVARLRRIKVLGRDALAFPYGWDGAEASIVEAVALGPDAGVEYTDDDVSCSGRFRDQLVSDI
ncbi:hypothetical protein M5K25_014954 [Dendrobium thyrsiflorum]|uniref:Uncharacterized protein n=1 Tax=Dendrobium thyrsiflorum TaxID=117978 RepID=A0ABD0UWS4_DENTH